MNRTISPSILLQLSKFVNMQMGLHFPEKRWAELARGISRATEDFGFDNVEDCVRWLLDTPLTRPQIDTLADHLTIGETYFFRENKALEALQHQIIPALLNLHRHEVKIWSAGCCTGEEPYSIAIMLDRYFPALAAEKITILATDINPHFLKKARIGRYRDWSFRNTPARAKEQYFSRLDSGEYQLNDRIRNRVVFFPLNLIEDSYPSILNNTTNLDIIFCRNVLIYFDQSGIDHVVSRFYRALTPGGWLAVSSTETSTVYYTQFDPVKISGQLFYRKQEALSTPPQPISRPPKVPTPAQPCLPETPVPSPSEPAGIAEALYAQALALFQQGRYDQTVNLIQNTLAECCPDNTSPFTFQPDLFFLLINAYANQGMLPEARQWGEKAINLDKLNPEYYYLLGNILQEQGEFDRATQAFKRVLYLEPDFTLAMVALGNLARQQGKIHEATRYFNHSLLVLKKLTPNAVLYGSNDVTAGELADIIQTILT